MFGASLSARAVLLLIVRLELRVAILDRAPPRLVSHVPPHRSLQRLFEIRAEAEAEVFELFGGDGVAAVVALAIGDLLDQRRRLARDLEDLQRDFAVLALVAAADVVRLAVRSALDYTVDRGAVIVD